MNAKRYQWLFNSAPENKGALYPILLQHDEMSLWIAGDIAEHPEPNQIRVVAIYDFMAQLGYVVISHDGVYYGEIQPLKTGKDGYSAAHASTFTWFTSVDKEKMLKLMRRAISFRTTPLPQQFRYFWEDAVGVIENLDIINPGSKRYIA